MQISFVPAAAMRARIASYLLPWGPDKRNLLLLGPMPDHLKACKAESLQVLLKRSGWDMIAADAERKRNDCLHACIRAWWNLSMTGRSGQALINKHSGIISDGKDN